MLVGETSLLGSQILQLYLLCSSLGHHNSHLSSVSSCLCPKGSCFENNLSLSLCLLGGMSSSHLSLQILFMFPLSLSVSPRFLSVSPSLPISLACSRFLFKQHMWPTPWFSCVAQPLPGHFSSSWSLGQWATSYAWKKLSEWMRESAGQSFRVRLKVIGVKVFILSNLKTLYLVFAL